MKNYIIKTMASVLTLTILLCTFAIFPAAAGKTPTVSIDSFNLTFESDTYIKYAVKFDGVDDASITRANTGMLYWTAPQDSYEIGSESSSSSIIGWTESIPGHEDEKYYTFSYDSFAAKNMTDYVYARAYVVVDGVYYYSNVAKYSILTYAYDMLGKTSEDAGSDNLQAMLNSLLAYGASAQTYFNYKADHLANADFYEVALTDGVLEDGFTYGLYLAGDTATLKAPATDADGAPFSHWADSTGKKVGASAEYALTVGAANETYTPVYGETAPSYSEGLEFDSNGDGTCCLVGIGDCTDTEVVIPPTSPEMETVTIIEASAFAGEPITSISIPATVKEIGRKAFNSCTSLTDVYFDGTEDEWNAITIGSNNDPLVAATKHFKEPEYTERTIVLSSATGAKGETVDITVSIYGNPGITNTEFGIVYDNSAMSIVAHTDGYAASDFVVTPPNQYVYDGKFGFDGQDATDANGVLITLTFQISENAPAGSYEISLTSFLAANGETKFDFEIVNGTITVE